ncbi:MFS transporter [Kribbella sancticallisti]|uniref:MFS transporter n=1 Tax=Kribbella sancticallisti TaxID=460087 RepID=A0ABP4Q055_9ACTN
MLLRFGGTANFSCSLLLGNSKGSPVPSISSVPTLWADRDFVRFWVGQTASQLGAQASQVTLPLLAVTTLGAGAAQLGALRAVQQAPILLFSLLVGVLVDRWRARVVMVLADFGRALALASIPLAYLLDALGIPLLYVVSFVVGVFTVCFDVAYQATLPRLVARDQLTQGNSLLEGSRSAAQISGPALGGGLISLLSAPIAAAASTFFFVLSTVSILRIKRPDVVPDDAGGETGVLRQIRAGLRLVAGDSSLRAIAVASCIYQFSFAALMTVYLLFLTRSLELSGAELGLVLAALGPGLLAGSLLSTWLPGRFGYGRVVVWAAATAEGVLFFVPALHGSGLATVAALMVINFLFGLFSQSVDIATLAIRQAITPLSLQGRVAATMNFLGLGLMPLGSLLGGVFAAQVGVRPAFLIAALAMCLSPLSLQLSPLARLGKSLPAGTKV